MKELTIKEIRKFDYGEWFWLVREGKGAYVKFSSNGGYYFVFNINTYFDSFLVEDYGTKWIAYRNKEQAEGIYEKVVKDTAKDILQMLRESVNFGYDYPDEPHSEICTFDPYLFEEIEEKYGIKEI